MRIAAGVLALVVLAGCSSGKDTYTPPPPPRSSSPSTAPPVAPRRHLLTVGELPTGWTVNNRPAVAQAALPPCYLAAVSTKTAKATASAAFAQGGTTPALIESIGYYPSAAAQARFASAVRRLDACKRLVYKIKKVRVTGTMSATSFPALGDASHAYTANLSAAGAKITLYLVVLRRGQQVAALAYAEGASGGIAAFSPLASTAADKLAS